MKILLASSIDSKAIEKLKDNHEVKCAFNAPEDQLKQEISDCEALIFRSGVQITAEVLAAAPGLKLVIRAGSGTDNVDLKFIREHNIPFRRIPEPGAKAVAELSFGMMIALARNILKADALVRQGVWAKPKLKGYLLTGKTLGIVGAGNIGSRVGFLGSAWGMNVIGCVEHPSPERAKELLQSKHMKLSSFDEVISQSDFISIHVPLKETTQNLINRAVFQKMKRGVYLINLARGGVVNEQDLLDALTKDKILAGAGVDVHEHEGEGNLSPFAGLPNVVVTPHIGAQTFDSQREIGERILELVNFQNTQKPETASKNEIPAARI